MTRSTVQQDQKQVTRLTASNEFEASDEIDSEQRVQNNEFEASNEFDQTLYISTTNYIQSFKGTPQAAAYHLDSMASPQDLRVVHEMGFAPLDPVDVRIGTMTVKLYPKITANMPVHERAHAFQVNKSALKDLPANFRLVIDAFGTQLNASSTVEGILSD